MKYTEITKIIYHHKKNSVINEETNAGNPGVFDKPNIYNVRGERVEVISNDLIKKICSYK